VLAVRPFREDSGLRELEKLGKLPEAIVELLDVSEYPHARMVRWHGKETRAEQPD
jgi:hypothetical protein